MYRGRDHSSPTIQDTAASLKEENMNIFIAIILWMIGLKLQMNNWYYLVIVLGVVFQFLIGAAKSSDHAEGGRE